jgi:hypothetical protein
MKAPSRVKQKPGKRLAIRTDPWASDSLKERLDLDIR